MDSTHGLSQMKRLLAETLIKRGTTEEEFIEEVQCHRSTFYRYKQNVRLFGQTSAPSISRMGRPSIFTQAMREVAFLSLFWSNYLWIVEYCSRGRICSVFSMKSRIPTSMRWPGLFGMSTRWL